MYIYLTFSNDIHINISLHFTVKTIANIYNTRRRRLEDLGEDYIALLLLLLWAVELAELLIAPSGAS